MDLINYSALVASGVAVICAVIGLFGSVMIFYYNRESKYLDNLAESYSHLFSQYRLLRNSVIERGDKMSIAADIYSAIYRVRIIDRDDSRVEYIDKIRGAAKVLAEHTLPWGENTESDTAIQLMLTQITTTIDEELLPSLRDEIIHKRPLKDLFP